MSQDLFRCGDVSLLVYLLVILFGLSSWVDINGLWVELPILVQNLPEGWDLPSYMAVIIQVANVAPLAYTVVSSIYPRRSLEIPVIYLIISTGVVACLLLAFLWDKTSTISGTQHSTGLFILQFFLALVDCTSSVAFLPFMSLFKPQYMTAYFIGEGFSGLIPSLVALGQGAGSMKCVNFSSFSTAGIDTITNDNVTTSVYRNNLTLTTTLSTGDGLFSNVTEALDSLIATATLSESPTASDVSVSVFPQYQPPKFTVQVFFFILMGLLVLSALSFTLLNYWSYCKMQYAKEVVLESVDMRVDAPFWSATQWDTDNEYGTPISSSTSDVDERRTTTTLASAKTKNLIYHDPDTRKAQQPLCIQNRYSCKGKIGVNKSKSKSADKSYAGTGSQALYKTYASPSSASSSSSSSSSSSNGSSEVSNPKKSSLHMSTPKYILFMVLTAWLCALSNGVLPSIQTYSCLPYGIQPYHLSVTLSSIANPIACFATFFLKMTSVTGTVVMSLLGSALSAFIVYTAATSPEPPLVDHLMGAYVIILSWVLVVFVLTYTKVAIATMCRHEGRKALLWVGANTQLGSLIGAIATFMVVNHLKLFQVANPCV